MLTAEEVAGMRPSDPLCKRSSLSSDDNGANRQINSIFFTRQKRRDREEGKQRFAHWASSSCGEKRDACACVFM